MFVIDSTINKKLLLALLFERGERDSSVDAEIKWIKEHIEQKELRRIIEIRKMSRDYDVGISFPPFIWICKLFPSG